MSEGEKINEIIGMFEELNPTYDQLFNMKTQRDAVKYLIDKYSFQEVENIVQYVINNSSDDYFPTIGTPNQLKKKLFRVKDYYERNEKKDGRERDIEKKKQKEKSKGKGFRCYFCKERFKTHKNRKKHMNNKCQK